METELKYKIIDCKMSKHMLYDGFFSKLSGGLDWTQTLMRAFYYDTADWVLREKGVAFRVRQEGSKKVATVKLSGKSEDGLHKRKEFNISADTPEKTDDISEYAGQCLGMFMQYDAFQKTGIDPLTLRLKMYMLTDFMRSSLRVRYKNCRCEVALDTGKICSGGKFIEVCELEIELLEGSEKDMLEFGTAVQKRYGLSVENETKVSRGLRLRDEK